MTTMFNSLFSPVNHEACHRAHFPRDDSASFQRNCPSLRQMGRVLEGKGLSGTVLDLATLPFHARAVGNLAETRTGHEVRGDRGGGVHRVSPVRSPAGGWA